MKFENKSKTKSDNEINDILDNYIYVTNKSWQFGLDDEVHRQFGILFEILDMDEATGEKEYEQYPFIVSASIIADKCHESFNESGHDKPTKFDLIYDCNSYMGGIPIDHVLTNQVKSSDESKDSFGSVCDIFKLDEACICSIKNDFGTIAAQQGKGTEHKYLQFKTDDAARKYIDFIIQNRVSCLGIMIGFILDRPINMIGDSGWSVIEKQVKGYK